MAVVWAKQAGNWSDTTLWAFWNENTQQIEDYGQVPQVDDVVYLNNYVVEVNLVNTSLISASEIHNNLNPHTNLSGGYIDLLNNTANTLTLTIDANIIGIAPINTQMIIRMGNDTNTARRIMNVIINGDVTNSFIRNDQRYVNTSLINGNVEHSVWYSAAGGSTMSRALTINGNFNNSSVDANGAVSLILNINGRVTNIGNSIISNKTNMTCNINGYINFSIGNNIIHNINVNGIADMSELSVNENLSYPFSSGYGLKKATDLTIITPHLTDYPIESNVKKDIPYAFNQMVGTYDINQYLPPESVVLKDFEYGDSDDRKTGTMEQEVNVEVGCVTPEDVRKDVPLVGMGVVGSLVVPSVDDVREGVIFDNGSVGTLIVEGGGDRLRIADFGYYTNAQSDTYIVDLTEQDKPKFAVAEERVLIEMFPELDLNNIPEKYFDDLFVKYLKYRLIVEYYRTAGINSTFTPSEPTTEIVNYQNVNCEIWMNIANTYLKAWGEKYPNSIKKQRILL